MLSIVRYHVRNPYNVTLIKVKAMWPMKIEFGTIMVLHTTFSNVYGGGYK